MSSVYRENQASPEPEQIAKHKRGCLACQARRGAGFVVILPVITFYIAASVLILIISTGKLTWWELSGRQLAGFLSIAMVSFGLLASVVVPVAWKSYQQILCDAEKYLDHSCGKVEHQQQINRTVARFKVGDQVRIDTGIIGNKRYTVGTVKNVWRDQSNVYWYEIEYGFHVKEHLLDLIVK